MNREFGASAGGMQPTDTATMALPSIVTAAHELKAPLSLIRQLAHELRLDSLDQATAERLVEQIILTSERSLVLTSEITRAARLEDSLFETEAVNPVHICEEVAHELTPLFKAHGKRIEVTSRRSPLLAVANRELLGSVIRQFADNALHYSDATHAVVLSSVSRGDNVRVSVRDFGPMVPISVWKTLSEKLGTGAQPLGSRPQSSGLGLFIAGQFARSMHAAIGTTRHRDGASFYVDLQASTQTSLL